MHDQTMHKKTIFDTVRRMLGRGFSAQEIGALDRAIDQGHRGHRGDRAERGDPACEASAHPVTIGLQGITLIKRFEGCARLRTDGMVEAYPDPASGGDPWTIGWGATGSGIGPDTVWTRAECDARLERDLIRYAEGVSRAIGEAPTTQAQFDALVSFHYNTGAIARATLTKRHCEGDTRAAAAEFARWNRAAGRVLTGLTRRRAAEAALYRAG